jgi:hypothetical protein
MTARRFDFHRACGVCDGSVAVNFKHIQVMVPNVRRTDIYAYNERMVLTNIHKHGGDFPRRSVIIVKNKKF